MERNSAMLRPQDTGCRERKNLDGLWRFALDRTGAGRAERLVDAPLTGDGDIPSRRAYNDICARRRGRATTSATSGTSAGPGAARLGRAADRAALRRRDASGDRLGRRHAGRRARGRLHAVRGRRHRARARGRGGAVTVVVNNELSGSRSRRASCRRVDGPPCSSTSTTSSTTRDCTGRCGCTRRRALTSATSPSSPSSTARRVVAYRTVVEAATAAGARHGARRRRRRGRRAAGPRASSRSPTCTLGARERLPVHARSANCGAAASSSTCYPQPFGVRTVARRRHPLPDQRRAVLLQGFGKHEDSRSRQGPRPCLDGSRLRPARWIGANSFRTSHYPYAKRCWTTPTGTASVLIDETAAVGLNMGLGGGIFGGQGFRPSPTRPSTTPHRPPTARRSAS